jgi:hypothetical protein
MHNKDLVGIGDQLFVHLADQGIALGDTELR